MKWEDWIALFVTITWSLVPFFFYWIQIIILFPTVNKDLYILDEQKKQSTSDKKHDQKAKHSSRGRYETSEISDVYQEIGDELTILQVKPHTWLKLNFADTLIFSRKWYRLLSDHSGILIPLYWWIAVWIFLIASRIISNFYVWHNRTKYPDPVFSLLIAQQILSILFDICWFPSLFKLRLTTETSLVVSMYTIFFAVIYGFRAAYSPDVGFGFSSAELVYYLYLTALTLIIVKEDKYTRFTDRDMTDISKSSPVTLFQDASINDQRHNQQKQSRTHRRGDQPLQHTGGTRIFNTYGHLPIIPTHTHLTRQGWTLQGNG
jgi:hypothetical protein